MATKLKIAAVALLTLAVLLLWRTARSVPEAPSRSVPGARTVAEAAQPDEEASAAASGREGASGAATPEEDDAEPPLAPGNGCVRGVIRFEDGEPLKGATVSLWGESKVYATTDAQGRFHLHDDWVAERGVYLASPDRVSIMAPSGFAFLLRNVKMVPDATVRVEIVVKRGMRVASRVVAAATGAPVLGATVVLRRWESGALVTDAQGEFGLVRTDAEGRFALDHVIPADYSVQIVAKGFEAQYAHWDLRERALPDEFRLEPARRLEIRLGNAPPSAIGTEVKWWMRRSGEQVPGEGGAPAYRQEMLTLDGEGTLGKEGLLVGDAPPPGRYDVTLWRTEKLPAIVRDGVEFGAAAVETLAIALDPGARVEGTVCWPDGTPVAGAAVLASGLSAETDEKGRFAFDWLPGAVAGASKEFAVRLDEADLPMGERAFGPGEPKLVDLTLPGKGSVRFELKGVEADRYGEIDVRRAGEDEPVIVHRIDRPLDGPIVLRGLPPGPLRLRIWQAGRSFLLRDLRVDGETQDLGVLEMPKWPRPRVLVRVPDGKTLPAWIYVWRADPDVPGVSEPVELDKEGRGVLPSLPPGRGRLFARSPFGPPVEVEIDVDPERPAPVEVLLDPG